MLTYAVERLAPVAQGVVGLAPDFARPLLELDTSDEPAHRQFVAWLEQVEPLIETLPDADPNTGFAAEFAAWDLGGLLLIETRMPRLAYRRTLRQCRSDGLDHWVLTAARMTGSGALSVLSLNQPFSGRVTAAETVHLCVPRDFLRQAALPMDSLNGAVVGSPLGRLLADFLLNLAERMPELEPVDYPGVQSSVRAMIESCIVPARLGLVAGMQPVEATLLERARRMVQQRLGSPTLGVDELCRDLAVSRSRLYRLFEPLGGVVHYIRHRRLLDAHVALADAENRRPIVDIAAERGFIDPAEFSRAFKREFGYRPSDARSTNEPAPSRPRPETGGRQTLTDLLHNLR